MALIRYLSTACSCSWTACGQCPFSACAAASTFSASFFSQSSSEFCNAPGTPGTFSSSVVFKTSDRIDVRLRRVAIHLDVADSAACNRVQGTPALLAFAATSALKDLQITESKQSCRVRIPASPSAHLQLRRRCSSSCGTYRRGRSTLSEVRASRVTVSVAIVAFSRHATPVHPRDQSCH